MGYSYCANTGRLACDGCGATDGKTRKRTCPHRVQYATGGSLPYCQPAALCPTCYAKHRPTLHAECKERAEARTAEETAKHARLTAGEMEVRAAWGSWHETVPDGWTGVYFKGLTAEEYRLVPADQYHPGARRYLSEYPTTIQWKQHAGQTTKEAR